MGQQLSVTKNRVNNSLKYTTTGKRPAMNSLLLIGGVLVVLNVQVMLYESIIEVYQTGIKLLSRVWEPIDR